VRLRQTDYRQILSVHLVDRVFRRLESVSILLSWQAAWRHSGSSSSFDSAFCFTLSPLFNGVLFALITSLFAEPSFDLFTSRSSLPSPPDFLFLCRVDGIGVAAVALEWKSESKPASMTFLCFEELAEPPRRKADRLMSDNFY